MIKFTGMMKHIIKLIENNKDDYDYCNFSNIYPAAF